jgi:energy-coupling factor transporter ATP-binding protein EcfA2
MDSIIYLEGVTVSFEGFKALNNLNFIMGRGELRVVIGPNGAGKTTLLDVICGRVRPCEGRVILGEMTEIRGLREDHIARLGPSLASPGFQAGQALGPRPPDPRGLGRLPHLELLRRMVDGPGPPHDHNRLAPRGRLDPLAEEDLTIAEGHSVGGGIGVGKAPAQESDHEEGRKHRRLSSARRVVIPL